MCMHLFTHKYRYTISNYVALFWFGSTEPAHGRVHNAAPEKGNILVYRK